MSTLLGIDTSYNRTINWTQAKADGVKFAIIKASQGYPDGGAADTAMKNYFVNNVAAATSAGILCGAYHYLSATNTKTGAQADNYSAETQANMLISNVKAAGGFNKVKLPLCIDIEINQNDPNDPYLNKSPEEITAIAKAFAITVSKAGFVPCLYMNKDFRTYRYILSELGNIPVWYARWSSPNVTITESIVKSECPMAWFWQTGDLISASWTSTSVDEDYCFLPLITDASSGDVAYLYMQTKTGSPVYIDYCTDKIYAPSGYSNEQIKACIRPMPNAEIYVSATNVTIAYGPGGLQGMSLVRY